MPPHLKKSINQAHLGYGTYEQNVTDLERELELNGLEAPDELPINNVSQQPTNTNADRPKPTCHHCKKPGHYRNQCRLLRKQRERTENNRNNFYFGAKAANQPPPRHRRPERQNQITERANQSDKIEAPRTAARNLN